MVLRNPLRAFLHLRQQHGLAIRFYHLQLWWWYFSYASFFIMLHSYLCFYGPPPYARSKTRGTNVLTRNHAAWSWCFLTLQWILSNVFSMSIKFIYQDDIHSKLCLMMLRQKNMLFVHHLGFFEIYFFLSFRWYPLHLSFYQAQSCILFQILRVKWYLFSFYSELRSLSLGVSKWYPLIIKQAFSLVRVGM